MRRLTEEQLDEWLMACVDDPSIVTPWEMGYRPDGTHRTEPTTTDQEAE